MVICSGGIEMDYEILDEHLKMMDPYFMKWLREYNILLFESDFKTNKYEVLIDGFGMNPKDLICQGYIISIESAFREMIKSYHYSLSASLIEKQLLGEGKEGWSNYWKYEIKNYYFRNIIPQFFCILDYMAVMINELSNQQLITKIHLVDFARMKDKLLNLVNGTPIDIEIGWLTPNDIKQVNKILGKAFLNISAGEEKVLRPYRNTITHRYLVGIDELTVNTYRKKLTDIDKKMLGVKEGFKYSIGFTPEYNFIELVTIIEKLINNVDLMIIELMELDIMREVIKLRELT